MGFPPQVPMTRDQAAIFHKAARMIELDGVEAYFACREKYGPTIAGAVLVAWLRSQHNQEGKWPDDDLTERVNRALLQSGRMRERQGT